MAKPTRRLGRGLDSLVSDLRQAATPPPKGPTSPDSVESSGLPNEPTTPAEEQARRRMPIGATIAPVEMLEPNPHQPRQHLDETDLESLAKSLLSSGMIQPITVRRAQNAFEIIAGERRWQAAKRAGLTHVPIIVREATDQEMLELALIENIHREDLNPIDRARAYATYCERFNYSADQVADRLGEDRSTSTNYLRLLDLELDLQELVIDGRLRMGHARCIVGVRDPAVRRRLAKAVVNNDLSVRALEEIVRREKKGEERADARAKRESDKSPHVRDLEERLSVATGTKVTVHEGRKKGTGRIIIEYYSLDDFDRIASRMQIPPER